MIICLLPCSRRLRKGLKSLFMLAIAGQSRRFLKDSKPNLKTILSRGWSLISKVLTLIALCSIGSAHPGTQINLSVKEVAMFLVLLRWWLIEDIWLCLVISAWRLWLLNGIRNSWDPTLSWKWINLEEISLWNLMPINWKNAPQLNYKSLGKWLQWVIVMCMLLGEQ